MTDYEVIKEIEVLREFAAGIRADLRRYIDKNPMDNFAVSLKEEVEKIYLNVYELDNLKDAYIVRGKLQMVNETLKKLGWGEKYERKGIFFSIWVWWNI